MKELNIIEAMAMPVGTKFKAVSKKDEHIIANLKINNDGFLTDEINAEKYYISKENFNFKFIQIPKPVSFMEAVKSDKYIRVDLTGIEGYGKKTIKELNTYMSLDEMFELLGNEFYGGYIKEIIEKGKWYIED